MRSTVSITGKRLTDCYIECIVRIRFDLCTVVCSSDKTVSLYSTLGRGVICRIDVFVIIHADVTVNIPVSCQSSVRKSIRTANIDIEITCISGSSISRLRNTGIVICKTGLQILGQYITVNARLCEYYT